MRPGIEIEPDYDQLCDAAAQRILAVARRAIAARGRFSLALSGGTTPRGVYQRLASAPLAMSAAWPTWHIFWGDERWVSPQDSRSNYNMACAALLDHVPVDPARVFPMAPLGWTSPAADRPSTEEATVATAASSYEVILESELDVDEVSEATLTGTGRRPPRLDLVLLGLGGDGHTASLFPGASALQEESRWVVATPAPGGAAERALPRLTMTLPILNAAREVVFLASGAAKSEIVAAVLRDAGLPAPERRPQPLPAARVAPTDGQLTWLLDADAAGELGPGSIGQVSGRGRPG
jgi:6-phosphogluconolactonase